MDESGRVLSIQSHVVRGYVGNKCSVFTLQLLGFDVDPVNSVQFSNHTGYRTFKGTVLQGNELASLVEGLEANDLLEGYTHMLTGYIGSPSFLRAVMGVYRTLKEANPGMLFICDPVLGDDGRLYVPAENVDIYRKEVLPLASMVTPNQFEAELLSGVTIRTQDDAVRACLELHTRGPDTVVITSSRLQDCAETDGIVLVASIRRRRCLKPLARRTASEPLSLSKLSGTVGQAVKVDGLGGKLVAPLDEGNASVRSGHLLAADTGSGATRGVVEKLDLGGALASAQEQDFDVFRVTFPRIPQHFTGTGDLAAALLLAWTHRLPEDFAGALERVAGTMRAVLGRTYAEGSAELLLIQSKEDIECPPLELRAVTIPIGGGR